MLLLHQTFRDTLTSIIHLDLQGTLPLEPRPNSRGCRDVQKGSPGRLASSEQMRSNAIGPYSTVAAATSLCYVLAIQFLRLRRASLRIQPTVPCGLDRFASPRNFSERRPRCAIYMEEIKSPCSTYGVGLKHVHIHSMNDVMVYSTPCNCHRLAFYSKLTQPASCSETFP